MPSRKHIKKPKKCEINFLPNFPEGHNDDSLESVRKEIQDEMKTRTPSSSLLAQQMDLTFALRRKEIVESAPAISDMLERWPALFREPQVSRFSVFNALKDCSPKQFSHLVTLMQCKVGMMEYFCRTHLKKKQTNKKHYFLASSLFRNYFLAM